MGTQQKVVLRDVNHGLKQSHARLLAPLRYVLISHPEKTRYDFVVPGAFGAIAWVVYSVISPKPAIFSDSGLLQYVISLRIMGVPFMIGALAAVAMGSPGAQLERRPIGAELYLDGRPLNLRSFVCYLLGYLSFLGMVTLGLAVFAELLHHAVSTWTSSFPTWHGVVRELGAFILSMLLAFLTVTIFWALYFLTDVVNRT